MQILSTIIPIFAVIGMGWLARRRGFIPEEFLSPANRLVFYIAIPAMIFRAIAKAPFEKSFDGVVLAATLIAIILFFLMIQGITDRFGLSDPARGTFMQSTFHGNLGYIGLAVAYYFLGEQGLARAGIIAGFVMILQNLLAVLVLQRYGQKRRLGGNAGQLFANVLANPVVFSAIAGIGFSSSGWPMPVVLARILEILSGMALPLALLLIGASLSFERIRVQRKPVLSASLLKLLALPALGFGLYQLLSLPPSGYLPGLILLAAPTATITFVMAREMNGDSDLAVATISASTLLSAFTFTFWLNI